MKKIKIFGKEFKLTSSFKELLPELDNTIIYTDKFIEAIRNLGVCILAATILASFLPHSLGNFISTPLLMVTCFIWSINVFFKCIRWYIKRKNIDMNKERSFVNLFIISVVITGILFILLMIALIPSLQTIVRTLSTRT